MGVLGLLVVAGLAWGFARVLDAPRWVDKAILLGVVLLALASQVLLPPEAPMRQSVGGAVRALVFLGIAAIPVLGYRAVLRRLRARHQEVHGPVSGSVTGEVALVPETKALAEDLRAALDAPVTGGFGLVHRDGSGKLVAGAVVTLDGAAATAEPVWWDDDLPEPEGVVRPLFEAMRAEAARRGAVSLSLCTRAPSVAAICAAEGLDEAPVPPGAPRRFWRSLP